MKLGNDDSREEAVARRAIQALAHPLRREIVDLLEAEAASPAMLREQIGAEVSPANLSYHCTVLQSCECIERVGVIPRQGADETLYRANPDISGWIAAAAPE